MIIPTPGYDPMFADDGISFRAKMIQYIRSEFADILGPQIGLLRTVDGSEDDGLETLSNLRSPVSTRLSGRSAAA